MYRSALFGVAAAGALVLWNPLNLERGPSAPVWDLVVTVIAVAGLVVGLHSCLGPGLLRNAVHILGGFAIVLTAYYGFVITAFRMSESPTDRAVLAVKGTSQLVAVEFHPADANTRYRVELRRRTGPIHQASVVWRGFDPPIAAAFVDPDGVVVTRPGYETPTCDEHSRIESISLSTVAEQGHSC